ncbi:MAG: glutamate--tRNA ligase [Saprospiraceae bacterium]|nr:glutamate--tRNA ligase [Saprospiraceae bacterium]
MSNVRVRFAPSPTGPLHIGGLRTALYNYLFARKHSGSFILRIEDTDQARLVSGAEEYIIKALDWSGFEVDEGPHVGGPFGPYRQSERKSIYLQYVRQLVDSGKAYYAFDSSEDLEAMRRQGDGHVKYDASTRSSMRNSLSLDKQETQRLLDTGHPYVVRLLVPSGRSISFQDEIRGEVTFDTIELDDKVILKADGLPTYHLANVVDDYLMKISHVIRGEEWLSSTAHHVLLYESMGWIEVMPKFAHLPLILKPSGKGKLSKRDGQKFGFPVFPLKWSDGPDGSFDGFDSVGFSPDAMINFLALLGWNPGTEQEMFTLKELIDTFSIEQIGKSGARFDYEKALWFNSQYISNQEAEDIALAAHPFFRQEEKNISIADLVPICALLRDRMKTYADLPGLSHFFFDELIFDQNTIRKKWNQESRSHYENLIVVLEEVVDFQPETIKQAVSDYIHTSGIRFGDIFPLLRIALTGDAKGPDLFAIAEILGRQRAMSRWKEAPTEFDRIIQSSENQSA